MKNKDLTQIARKRKMVNRSFSTYEDENDEFIKHCKKNKINQSLLIRELINNYLKSVK